MRRHRKMQMTIGALLATAIGVALAHGGASGIVKERMDLMEGMGESMETLSDMFKGKTSYDAEAVKQSARRISELGRDKIIELFPAGSLHAPSEALPAIWEDWQTFEELAVRVSDYSDALVQAADNPQQMPGALGANGTGGQGVMMGRGHSQGMMMGARGTQDMMMGRGAMMGGDQVAPDPSHLAMMPPQAAFMHLADTCNSCHTRFRLEKESEE